VLDAADFADAGTAPASPEQAAAQAAA